MSYFDGELLEIVKNNNLTIKGNSKETAHHTNTTSNSNGTAVDIDGYTAIAIQITGTPDTATLTFEGTIDGTNWVAIQFEDVNSGTASTTTTTAGIYYGNIKGIKQLRVPISSVGTGTDLTVISNATSN